MTDLDNSPATSGPGSDGGPMPFFPAPPGRHATPPAGVPLSGGPGAAGAAPPAAPKQAPPPAEGRHQRGGQAAPHEPMPAPVPRTAAEPEAGPASGRTPPTAVVKGRITIEDEVVEKIAALAALEVDGVAALSERVAGGGGVAPPRAGGGGVRVHARDNEVALDLTVVVEYGCVVMDVAKLVKTNVARVISLMLGMRVTAVNVVVDDVRRPVRAG